MGLRLCFACEQIFQIFTAAKPPTVSGERHFKYKEVIAMCNTPGTLFIRFLILFGPFILLVPIR